MPDDEERVPTTAEILDAATVSPGYALLAAVGGVFVTVMAFHSYLTTPRIALSDLEELTAKVAAWPPPRYGLELVLEGRSQTFFVADFTLEDAPGVREAPLAAPPGTLVTVLVRKEDSPTRLFGLRARDKVLLSAEDALRSEELNNRWALYVALGGLACLVALALAYFFYPAALGLRPGQGW